MPDAELLRSTLRAEWHLVPSEITALDDVLLSRGWEVTAGPDRYVVRLSDPGARLAVEAGLAAADLLRGRGIAAGEPVRTLSGGLTARTEAGAFAVLRRTPGRHLDGRDPVDQQWWGDRLGAVHRTLQGFHHAGLRSWQPLDPEAGHLDSEPWLRGALADASAAATRLTITDRLTYGVLHGDPAPGVFVVDPGTGRAGVLDCGASGVGPLVYDVAAAVLYAGGVARAGELIDGYLAAGPVEAGEMDAALPVLLRLRWAVKADRAARWGCPEKLRRAREALESAPG
ncbi:phosphotransferase [Actinoplanes sp. LDG1-06]|uniref:Phosphotransferase n=1 Tax=Paractinoplanes ovalisporus TaxID=2810368 RepID=A0ABS2A5S1_9ACTN|nr:phosphotransferase [Actinoplanes ovalisporus]MBM2615192.1 phosphotransferase [Actinoplanes ovalisporus]